MKNLPQRERPAKRARSAYCRSGKREYQYPAWVTHRQPPPAEICSEIVQRFRSKKWPIPAYIQQGAQRA